ncbi:MAG: PIN domain-containing protein [Pseudomonadota bacterium]
MILADTSIWIDVLSSRASEKTGLLIKAVADERAYMGDLIALEVLQGIRKDTEFIRVARIFDDIENVSLCGSRVAQAAASNYRFLRRKGVTVRSSIDVIIATWCIENDVALLHNDRDFLAMEEHFGLIAM